MVMEYLTGILVFVTGIYVYLTYKLARSSTAIRLTELKSRHTEYPFRCDIG